MKTGEARSGAEALSRLKAAADAGEPFDVVLLDLMMPEMDGFELAARIKSLRAIPQPKLVMISSIGDRGESEKAEATGIDAYLSKPYCQKELLDCLLAVAGIDRASSTSHVTRFTLTDESEAAKKSSRVETSRARPGSKRRSILVVDDNPVNQMVAQTQLQQFGYRADVAANGLEAVEILSRLSYDLVLMDCQMPEMDGYAATKEIRRRESGKPKKTPIVAMTAHAIQDEREKCLAAGMDDYLSKPVSKEALLRKVEHWLNQKVESANDAGENGFEYAEFKSGISESNTSTLDLDRLDDITTGDAEMKREIVSLYLKQTGEQLVAMGEAIGTNDAERLYQLAHKSAGASVTCGMTAVAFHFRQLGRMGKNRCLENAAETFRSAQAAFARTANAKNS